MEDCDRDLEMLGTKIATSESYLNKLTAQLEQLHTKEQEEQQTVEGIPPDTWQMVM